MKCLFFKLGGLSFYFILLLAVTSCKKDGSADEQNENLQSVNFKISGFSSSVASFKATGKQEIQAKTRASKAGAQNYVEGYLYFWSFNSGNLEPDVAYQKEDKPSILTNGSSSYVAGYSFEGYQAGKSLSLRGASEVLLKFPIGNIEQVTQFGFDTGSSDTGPKDFELYYSLDEGNTYIPLAMNNQFGKTGDAAPKNTYVYQLSDRNIIGSNLWFKFIPKAGTRREGGSDYKESTGTWRFDNIRLLGMSSLSQVGNPINKLHYFVFHKDKAEVVITGSTTYEEASSLTLNLAKGSYSVCFVSNESAKELLFPESPTLSGFYIGNIFSNSNAAVFGYVGDLEVAGDMESQIKLQRLFSQVKLEFTDAADLSVIKKIGISQKHDPLFFAPFNDKLANPILDQSDVEIVADFNSNKQLIFNQFMGMNTAMIPLKYEVVLYGSAGVLRTFQLESVLKNNMQLVFRGNLLNESNSIGKFQIYKNTAWDGQEEKAF